MPSSGYIPTVNLKRLDYLYNNLYTIRKRLNNITANDCLLDNAKKQIDGLQEKKQKYINELCQPIHKKFLNEILASIDNYFRLEQDLDSSTFDLTLNGAKDFKTQAIDIGKKFKEFTIELLRNIDFDSRDQVIKDGKDFFMQSSAKLDKDLREATDLNWNELKQKL